MVQNYRLKKKISAKMDGIGDHRDESMRMHKSDIEDGDFQGLSGEGSSPEELTARILAQMSLQEKILYISGYKELAIHPLPRFGLPSVWCSDATSGLRSFPGGTSFPANLALTATWNEELISSVGEALSHEFRHKGISVILGPGVNIYRVPTCGRNFEYMGEDPHLAGKMAAAYIRGARKGGLITAVKHFACNNSEYDRHKTNSVVNERALREIYLPAFEMAVKEGGTGAVMSAYNPVNGTYASENRKLLHEILRKEWQFNGFVISDWNSLYSTAGPVKNGLDLEMPHPKWLSEKRIRKALKKGLIRESDLDRMVTRLMGTLMREGVYHRPQKEPERPFHTRSQIAIAEKAAQEGIILLKNNDRLLPFDPQTGGTLIVTGRMARNTETGGGGSSYVQTAQATDFLRGIQKASGKMEVKYIPWEPGPLREESFKQMREAAAVVYCAGFNHIEESEGWDRPWDLPFGQSDSILSIASENPNTVVVMTAGGGVNTTGWIDKVKAFIHSFYLGETGGEALGKILFGRVNPSGKLPFTMSEHWEDFGATAHYVTNPDKTSLRQIVLGQGNPHFRRVRNMEYLEGIFVGYRHFERERIPPLFPFGFGMSYTNFKMSGLKTSVSRVKGFSCEVSLILKNTGPAAGAEVVQIYIRDPKSDLIRPPKELKAFSKVFLQPGESRTVSFSLGKRAFQYYDPYRGDWRLEPGEFIIMAGNSSRDIQLKETILVEPKKGKL